MNRHGIAGVQAVISGTGSDPAVVQASGDENDGLYARAVANPGRISEHGITREEAVEVPRLLCAAAAAHQIGDVTRMSIVNDGRDAPTDLRHVTILQRG